MAKKPSVQPVGESGDNGGEPTFIDPASATGGSDTGSGGSDGSAIRDSTGAAFDPTIHVDAGKRNSDGSFRRKRGRRAGSTNGAKKVHTNLEASIDGLTKGLALFHMALAGATRTPELVLDDDEAKSLATATVNVLDLYDIRPDPKVEAVVSLIAVSIATYAPRAVAIRLRKEQEREEQNTGTAGVYTADGHAAGTTTYSADSFVNPDNHQNNRMN